MKSLHIQEVEASLKKIIRAKQELHLAEELFRSMMNQNKWLIFVELGWAQTKLECLLMEIEKLFLTRPELDENRFLDKSGYLERNILEGMRRIRSVLDLIPFDPTLWDEIISKKQDGIVQNIKDLLEDWKSKHPQHATKLEGNDVEKKNISEMLNSLEEGTYPLLIEMERMVYALWLKFFVVGAFYSSLLNILYKETLTISKADDEMFYKAIIGSCADVSSKEANDFRSRWKYWCNSVRFNTLADFVHLKFENSFSKSNENFKHIDENFYSLRKIVISVMKNESGSKQIETLWNLRRGFNDSAGQ